MIARWIVGQQVNRSSDRSCTRSMIHNKIHLINPSCPRPNIALQLQNCGLKHHSFHFTSFHYTQVHFVCLLYFDLNKQDYYCCHTNRKWKKLCQLSIVTFYSSLQRKYHINFLFITMAIKKHLAHPCTKCKK